MSLNFYTLDLKGNPQKAQTVEDWVHWATHNTHDRIVLKTRVNAPTEAGGVATWIVTIFLGIDFGREAFDVETLVDEPLLPLLYETMVFGGIRPGFSRKFPDRVSAVDFHHALENMVREATEEGEIMDENLDPQV